MNDHYSNLGVSPDATDSEIKSAFRRLARQYHPDLNPGDAAKSRFLSIKDSYETLSNPERKAVYDRFRKRGSVDPVAAESRPQAQPDPGRVQTAGYFSGRQAWKDEPAADISKEEFLRRQKMVSEMERLSRQGRLAEAEAVAKQLSSLGIRNAAVYGVLGDAARIKGDFAEAAKQFGYAAQYDPSSDRYRDLSVAMMEALARKPKPSAYQSEKAPSYALLFGLISVVAAVCYTAVAREPAIASGVAPVSTWTLGQIVMAGVAGFSIGSSLSAAGQIEHFDLGGGAAGYRLHPGIVVLLVSLANFWLAAALYVLVGLTQKSFHAGVTKVLAGSALAVGALSMARFGYGWEAVAQTAVWSGGIVYPAGLAGWLLADSLRRV
ncbi:MAG: DnaJ domain-containing protein [Armatimonadetes bacterium]|nr:DnaJ domain-containing protein [Armatimonadota bacterium]MBX3108969.1 DnaJ domain-containing protein [Fimbriimonadaceae bacterium]